MKLSLRVFAGTAVAALVAFTATYLDVTHEETDSVAVPKTVISSNLRFIFPVETDSVAVPKTVISSNLRFIFPVGLEGTGHHFFAEVNEHLFRTNKKLSRVSQGDNIKVGVYRINSSMRDAQHYIATLSKARDSMRKLAQRGVTMEAPGTIAFPNFNSRNSYPNGHGPNKALKYTDLRLLAEVAEEEGVDLRVIYLRRPVKSILIANTIHRDFQNHLHNPGYSTPEELFMQYVQILFTDIAVLHSMLAELSPGFLTCLDYDRAGDVDQSASIADFLAPNGDVAEPLKQSLIDVGTAHAKSNESLPYEGDDVVAARLQRKMDVFESQLCSGRR